MMEPFKETCPDIEGRDPSPYRGAVNYDNIEYQLSRNLSAQRSMLGVAPPHRVEDLQRLVDNTERQLYEYRLKIGSPLAYFTYER